MSVFAPVRACVRPNVFPTVGDIGVDPLVSAFAAESGATDLGGLNTLVSYVRAEGLIDNFVIYPMKSAQNAGSGSTVYSLGGLTTNDMTLVNSPTWGSSGITLNGTNQYATIADFLGSETITSFVHLSHVSAAPTALSAIISQWNDSDDNRSWLLLRRGNVAGDPYGLNRSVDGTGLALNSEAYNTTDNTGTTNAQTLVSQWVDGGGRSFWQDKTERTLSLISGTAQTARFNTAKTLLIGAVQTSSPTAFDNSVYANVAIVNTAITTTQREKITDLINDL